MVNILLGLFVRFLKVRLRFCLCVLAVCIGNIVTCRCSTFGIASCNQLYNRLLLVSLIQGTTMIIPQSTFVFKQDTESLYGVRVHLLCPGEYLLRKDRNICLTKWLCC